MSVSAMQGMGGMPNMQEILEGWKSDPTQMLENLEGSNPDLYEKLTSEFDADGNGELSEEEMQALQEKMVGMHEMMAKMAAPPAPPQGEAPPDKDELIQGWQEDPEQMFAGLEEIDSGLHQKLMDEFDVDGDGELSDEEMQALQDKMVSMLEEMPERPAPPQGVGNMGSIDGEEESDTTATLLDALSGSGSTTDAADADGDGVVTDQELADYLGVSLDDLNAIRTGRGQRAESDKESDGGFGKDAMGKAIQAYLTNIDNGLTDGFVSLGGSRVTATV